MPTQMRPLMRAVEDSVICVRNAGRSQQLIAEFGETRPADVIRGCADRVLDQYDDVPIRSQILTLATNRRASASAKRTARSSKPAKDP
jgi:hypothetical protein